MLTHFLFLNNMLSIHGIWRKLKQFGSLAAASNQIIVTRCETCWWATTLLYKLMTCCMMWFWFCTDCVLPSIGELISSSHCFLLFSCSQSGWWCCCQHLDCRQKLFDFFVVVFFFVTTDAEDGQKKLCTAVRGPDRSVGFARLTVAVHQYMEYWKYAIRLYGWDQS